MIWTAVIVASIACYLLKLIGLSMPESVLSHPGVQRVANLLPVAMLAALIAVQTFSTGQTLVLDARAVGLGAAALALIVRAPFLVVVATGAIVTALVRQI